MNRAEFEGKWDKLTASVAGLEIEAVLLGVMAEDQTTSQLPPSLENAGPDPMLGLFFGAWPTPTPVVLTPDEVYAPDKWLKIVTDVDGIEAYATSTDRIITVISMDRETAIEFYEYHSAYLDHECEEAATAIDQFTAEISDSVACALWPEMREAIEANRGLMDIDVDDDDEEDDE